MKINNDRGYTVLTDEEIIASCSSKEIETDCTDEIKIDDDNSTTMCHGKEATQLDQLMIYFEQQTNSTLK